MGYDDGFYYGQAILVCLAENDSDNGKTVTVSNGLKQWTGTIANKICTIKVPGKERYTVSIDNYSTEVEASYGDCKAVHLADGYDPVYKWELDSEKRHADLLEGNVISLNSTADWITGKENVIEDDIYNVNKQLTSGDNKFIFDYQDGQYGYNTSETRGADTFHPFFQSFNNAAMFAIDSSSSFKSTSGKYLFLPNSRYFEIPSDSLGTLATGKLTLKKKLCDYSISYMYFPHFEESYANFGIGLISSVYGNEHTAYFHADANEWYSSPIYNKYVYGDVHSDETGITLNFFNNNEWASNGNIFVAVIYTGNE